MRVRSLMAPPDALPISDGMLLLEPMVDGPLAAPVSSVVASVGVGDVTLLLGTSRGMLRMACSSVRRCGGPAERDVEAPLPFDHLAQGLAAHGRGHARPGHRPRPRPSGALRAVDGEGQVRLAQIMVHAHVVHAADAAETFTTWSESRSSPARSGPMIFTQFSPRTPESDSMIMLRMFCEMFQSTPTMVCDSSRSMASIDLLLGAAAGVAGEDRPLVLRLQRQVELGIEEARGVGAVVGAADLAQQESPPRDSAS